LQEKLKIYNEIKNDLIKKYATNEEKNEIKLPKVKEEDYTEKDKLDVESFNNFNKEFTDYLNKEEEYKFLGIKLPDSFLINLTIKEEEYLRNEKILL